MLLTADERIQDKKIELFRNQRTGYSQSRSPFYRFVIFLSSYSFSLGWDSSPFRAINPSLRMTVLLGVLTYFLTILSLISLQVTSLIFSSAISFLHLSLVKKLKSCCRHVAP